MKHQNDEKRGVWQRKVRAHASMHTLSAVKHGWIWAYVAAYGTGSLMFTDDVAADRSTRMDSESTRATSGRKIQSSTGKGIG